MHPKPNGDGDIENIIKVSIFKLANNIKMFFTIFKINWISPLLIQKIRFDKIHAAFLWSN